MVTVTVSSKRPSLAISLFPAGRRSGTAVCRPTSEIVSDPLRPLFSSLFARFSRSMLLLSPLSLVSFLHRRGTIVKHNPPRYRRFNDTRRFLFRSPTSPEDRTIPRRTLVFFRPAMRGCLLKLSMTIGDEYKLRCKTWIVISVSWTVF